MKDQAIIDLYWTRSEDAISQTEARYGGYCYSIAYGILESPEDSEECVNDTYLKAWNLMPPQRPNRLATFLGKLTRNLALDRWRMRGADKRGGGQPAVALEELRECVPAEDAIARRLEEMVLSELLNRFLKGLLPENRKLFVRRYWYMSSVAEIAREYGMSESKVKMSLLRTREKLKQFLEKEGICVC